MKASYVGFFGKLPVAGDFVSRGLGRPFLRAWDGWVSRHLMPRMGRHWPNGGLRFELASGDRIAIGVILPAADALGREFPLSLLAVLPDRPDEGAQDLWCDAALALAEGALSERWDADHLGLALDELPPPACTAAAASGAAAAQSPENPMFLWQTGGARIACPSDSPGAALDALLPET